MHININRGTYTSHAYTTYNHAICAICAICRQRAKQGAVMGHVTGIGGVCGAHQGPVSARAVGV